MNLPNVMLVAKKTPVTRDVAHYHYNPGTKKWDVTYKSGNTFHYNYANFEVLKQPKALDAQAYQIMVDGMRFDGLISLLCYSGSDGEYWQFCDKRGNLREYPSSRLDISRSALCHAKAREIFSYLEQATTCISVVTEDDNTALLQKQYKKLHHLDERTAAADYLNPAAYQATAKPNVPILIFPFGCNESQFAAVTAALSHKISVIEGPPGTGKTQTILNILANLVLRGQTVQVVSNNNSAIDNVLKKLAAPACGIDFIAAPLGRKERKEDFIQSQTGRYPDLTEWYNADCHRSEFLEALQNAYQKLQAIFRAKNELAKTQAERAALQCEQENFQACFLENAFQATDIRFKRHLSADKLLLFWQEYQGIVEKQRPVVLFYRLLCRFSYGVSLERLLQEPPGAVLCMLQKEYYLLKAQELDAQIEALQAQLRNTDAETLLTQFTTQSMIYFRNALAERYGKSKTRPIFTLDTLWRTPVTFLQEYPVILGTCYTARSSLSGTAQFDYVIMDEASQINIPTGFLALSSAQNAVVVGDTRQLSHIVTREERAALTAIAQRYPVPPAYDCIRYNFLRSLRRVMGDRVPQTILREHYRCHPQIIGFCNQQFYRGELIIMTTPDGEKALQLYTTVPGKHERDHTNLRQAQVIRDEVLPQLDCPKSEIGIIAPYRDQIELLEREIREPEIEIDTVHKFQGREKDVIIFCTTNDVISEFADQDSLINVAISRAKKKLILIASPEEQPKGSNLGALEWYIRYNNCDIHHSAISSVFDYLYNHYAEARRSYLQKHKRISRFDSENLMYALIEDMLAARPDVPLGVVCHYPLHLIFANTARLDEDERRYVMTDCSHLDFLIYNRVSHQPLLAIEVDGWHYHRPGSEQAERDHKKNHILEVYHLPLLRFATNGSGEAAQLSTTLDALLTPAVEKNA